MQVEFRLILPSDRYMPRNFRAKAVVHRRGAELAKLYGCDNYAIARVIDNRRHGGEMTTLSVQTFGVRAEG